MSKSILIVDTPKGCIFCPVVKMHGFSAYTNYTPKGPTTMNKQPYLGITCPFCNGIRYIYDLKADEVLAYKFEDCPLKEVDEEKDGRIQSINT